MTEGVNTIGAGRLRATRWIEEFGYVTIPVLSLTAFALVFAFLLLAALERPAIRTIVAADD